MFGEAIRGCCAGKKSWEAPPRRSSGSPCEHLLSRLRACAREWAASFASDEGSATLSSLLRASQYQYNVEIKLRLEIRRAKGQTKTIGVFHKHQDVPLNSTLFQRQYNSIFGLRPDRSRASTSRRRPGRFSPNIAILPSSLSTIFWLPTLVGHTQEEEKTTQKVTHHENLATYVAVYASATHPP